MNPNIFNINWNVIATWFVPKKIRKPFLLSWVWVLVYPFSTLHQQFLLFRKAKLYHLMITSQKCWLERLLNDRYDSTERRIYIDDLPDTPPVYIFRRDENKPLALYRRSENRPVYLYTRNETEQDTDYFIVWVPVSLVFNKPEMTSLVKIYKLVGTKFIIQTY
ncbi:MAG: hypothetical protein ABS68_00310 [Niastella sp. SCN 39-18]|nr:hypothetical protein [Sphingobacteriales bacterium]ODT55194.1 MAG: hypothetical protein ABS68_00310 [Niastella sp. SCN 39-18]OJW09094.1 MAG: hypothetical protein BGO53_00095 [Sphingobacteriales bacterium 39-19]